MKDPKDIDWQRFRYIVVGAGFWGATLAERIANDLRERVLVIERRNHIGGNAYSRIHPETGIEYHVYGTHIFHTEIKQVLNYLSRFTAFNGYRHQVLSVYRNKVFQMPINLETINSFYRTNLKPFEVRDFLKKEIAKETFGQPGNFEEKAISLVGRRLYEALIKGYTKKQWQKDPKELPVSLFQRLPVRENYDESYYRDRWQGIPLDGYTQVFSRMLLNSRITIRLNCDFFDIRQFVPESSLILYSGPIDRFYNFRFGRLEWRSIDLCEEVQPVKDYQGTAVMNYAEEKIPYTRIHEPRHLHPERSYTNKKTLIIKEYPCAASSEDNPYYPVHVFANMRRYKKYSALKHKSRNVIMGGRLADYGYYDMDHVIESALETYERRIKRSKHV